MATTAMADVERALGAWARKVSGASERRTAREPRTPWRQAALYAITTGGHRGRRETVFVAFGLVNAWWAKQELGTTVHPARIERVA